MRTRRTHKLFTHTISIILLLSLLLAAKPWAAAKQAAAVGLYETDVTLAGGVLTITDDNGGSSNDNLALRYTGGTYTLGDSGGLLIDASTIAGSAGSGTNIVTFPDTGITSIVFDSLGGNDSITVNSVQPAFSGNFTITGGTGLDTAIINADIATTGSGAVNITVSGKIWLNSGSSLTTVDGGITLDANAAGAQTADFVGIEAYNAIIQTTGAGDIQLLGKGSDAGGDTYSMYGVYLGNGTSVSSTATGASAGKVIINGTGANGPGVEYGVYLQTNTTDITSVDGDIEITGTGGNGSFTAGISVNGLEKIESTGTGANAANISLTGVGGNGAGGSNYGIDLFGSTADVTTIDGDITISGTGNGSGSSNYGISLSSIEGIKSTGIGADAGTITITGTGGNGGVGSLYGVSMGGSTTDVSSVDGDIRIEGTGGNGSGDGNVGVFLSVIEKIESTGTGSMAGTITVIGTSGTGASYNNGIEANGFSTDITSIDGDILMTGNSNGTTSANHGLEIGSIDKIASTGTGVDAATITINGTTAGNNNSSGIALVGKLMSVAGAVELNGTATGSGGVTYGVSAGNVQVTDAPLTIHGIASGGNSHGVFLGGNIISIGSGSITIRTESDSSDAYQDLYIANANIGDGTHVGAATPATGNITIIADSFQGVSANSIESDGFLTIQTRTPGTTIDLGYFSGGTGTLKLHDTLLTYLQDGFSSITIGKSDAGKISVDSAIFTDPLTLLTAVTIANTTSNPNITNNGNITTFAGTLAPGASPGTFRVSGDIAFANSSTFTAELTGATTTGPHDKLTATGSVTIDSNVSLNLDTSAYTTHEAGVVTLIENGSGAVSGTFSGLPEGAQTNNGGTPNFIISYVGGDGNDVTLTAASPTALTDVRLGATALAGMSSWVLMAVAGGLGVLSLVLLWRRRML